jgi:hypothetical protein
MAISAHAELGQFESPLEKQQTGIQAAFVNLPGSAP